MTTKGIVLLSFKFVGNELSRWLPCHDAATLNSLAALPHLYVVTMRGKGDAKDQVLGGIIAASALDKGSDELESQMKLAVEGSAYSKDVAGFAGILSITPINCGAPFGELTDNDLLEITVRSFTSGGTGGSV